MHAAVRLYDLEEDLAEEQDLAAEHPELVGELVGEMKSADRPTEEWRLPPPK